MDRVQIEASLDPSGVRVFVTGVTSGRDQAHCSIPIGDWILAQLVMVGVAQENEVLKESAWVQLTPE